MATQSIILAWRIPGMGAYWAAVSGATQALPLGIAFPPLHPCWKAGQSTMFSRESEVWIFMYNLLILMLATNFFPKRTVGTKSSQ